MFPVPRGLFSARHPGTERVPPLPAGKIAAPLNFLHITSPICRWPVSRANVSASATTGIRAKLHSCIGTRDKRTARQRVNGKMARRFGAKSLIKRGQFYGARRIETPPKAASRRRNIWCVLCLGNWLRSIEVSRVLLRLLFSQTAATSGGISNWLLANSRTVYKFSRWKLATLAFDGGGGLNWQVIVLQYWIEKIQPQC